MRNLLTFIHYSLNFDATGDIKFQTGYDLNEWKLKIYNDSSPGMENFISNEPRKSSCIQGGRLSVTFNSANKPENLPISAIHDTVSRGS